MGVNRVSDSLPAKKLLLDITRIFQKSLALKPLYMVGIINKEAYWNITYAEIVIEQLL